MAESESKRAADLVSRFIDTIGAKDEQGVVPFVQRWNEIVGPDIAAHSRVLDLKNGAVLVGLDHPAWIQQLHFQKTRVIQRIRRLFPQLSVRYLHFIVVDDIHRGRDRPNPRDDTRQDRTPTRSVERTSPPNATAASDTEFQEGLEGLRRAIEARNPD